MNVIKQSIGTAMVIVVGACGGGGGGGDVTQPAGGVPTPPQAEVPTLTAAGDTMVLQGLSLTGADTIIVQDATKASSEASWASARKLDYVTGLDNFDIVGVKAPEIYKDITFVATDMADVNVTIGSNTYVMSNGDVDASIDPITGKLTVALDWSYSDIDPDPIYREQGDPFDIEVDKGVTLDISTTTQGASCGGANLFCGGTMDIAKNGTSAMAGIALGNDQYKAGLYGTAKADVELGGRISYTDEPTQLTVIGSFVAAQGVPQ